MGLRESRVRVFERRRRDACGVRKGPDPGWERDLDQPRGLIDFRAGRRCGRSFQLNFSMLERFGWRAGERDALAVRGGDFVDNRVGLGGEMKNWVRWAGIVMLTALVCGAAMGQNPAPAATQKSVAERLGYPADSRLLIIHADDFGMMHSVDTAIEEAFEKHWITSASILVPCPWFPEVARWAKQHPDADLGIHLALTSEWTDLRWGPVSGASKVASLVDSNGYFPSDTPEVDQNAKMPDVEYELRSQIDR